MAKNLSVKPKRKRTNLKKSQRAKLMGIYRQVLNDVKLFKQGKLKTYPIEQLWEEL
ncbi:hypothetical protein [Mucilaginibacter pankratovii]|uniref:hypothetical protein n=1 Tax=Mucilaginibacter pankratovii TaxID=2772110 RepID=UPI0017464149|nr:hypothetical protein [Mucilaginibacter pankratovii]